jgi:hypothetical protein
MKIEKKINTVSTKMKRKNTTFFIKIILNRIFNKFVIFFKTLKIIQLKIIDIS